ncbi:MAG: hypothetical protein NWE94_06855 [Candidatus Bathyarchaeota archaeon]|nr:hypothetical protein [Candidatus Bathyarchaeota archaeon]
MVKLRYRVTHRKYKGETYASEEYTLNFPKELHQLLSTLRNRQLKITAKKEGNTIHITLTENTNTQTHPS